MHRRNLLPPMCQGLRSLCILFTGYLRMDTLLFVWDQYMIGLDSPGFNVELLAIITAIILGLLKDKFKECQTVSYIYLWYIQSNIPYIHDCMFAFFS
jgi:hypothetical protein